ncbi:uncharacterized protein LOC133376110 [Rhineura floridana]|uniref:uncharacterized protein LOC133376110 n=1 Tax=Rhineura floridana TaxID=261503 RepID=UPI002AC812F6|nr:uncharacterized protein LOC133376110 [Rhineura floridana]
MKQNGFKETNAQKTTIQGKGQMKAHCSKENYESCEKKQKAVPPVRRIGSKLPKRLRTRKIRMTRDAWGMLHSYVDGIYRKVSGEAERLRRKDRRPSIISSDVQSVLRQVMPRKYTRRIAYSKTR